MEIVPRTSSYEPTICGESFSATVNKTPNDFLRQTIIPHNVSVYCAPKFANHVFAEDIVNMVFYPQLHNGLQ